MLSTRALKRLLIFLACLAASGWAPLLSIFALKDAARFGLGLVVLGSWLLALAALLSVGIAWVFNARLGKSTAVTACALGLIALLAYPSIAGFAGKERWLSEFAGALGIELLATSPCVLFAIHLASYHASKGTLSAA
jgi:hypothetical protein